MTQTGSTAAFLPFLKKKPLQNAAARPAKQDDDDPLALPIPPAPKGSTLGNSSANTKFLSKLNGKAGSGQVAGNRPAPLPKSTGIAGTTKLNPANGAVANTLRSRPGGIPTAGGPAAGTGKPAAKPVLSAAEAKAEAEKRRLRQLQRLAKLGVLTKQDADPVVLAKIEEAKQQAAAIQRQQELEAKRKTDLEQRRKEIELRRQQQDQERQRLIAEKQRLQAAKAGKSVPPGSGSSLGAKPAAGTGAAAAAGQGRGAGGNAAGLGASRAAAAAGRGPSGPSSAAGGGRGAGQQQQEGKDPYAGLNPKQRAFLLARQRERERRMGGLSSGGAGVRPARASYDSDEEPGYYNDYDDDLDDFIDDDTGDDWRSELRKMTGYDPSKYKDSFFDDRRMEASAAEIQAEERRSRIIGKTEDEREAEAEARRLAAKEAKRKSKKRGAAALFDD